MDQQPVTLVIQNSETNGERTVYYAFEVASERSFEMVSRIAALQDYSEYRDLNWEGSFEDYLRIVREKPQVTRNAFQRGSPNSARYFARSAPRLAPQSQAAC